MQLKYWIHTQSTTKRFWDWIQLTISIAWLSPSHLFPLSPKGKAANHQPFLLQGLCLRRTQHLQQYIFWNCEKGNFKANSQNTALFHLLLLSNPGMIASPGPKSYTRGLSLRNIRGRWSPERPSTLAQSKQLWFFCRTFPAVHKQAFVSPPLDTSSFYLPPSGQICLKGRWCLYKQGF